MITFCVTQMKAEFSFKSILVLVMISIIPTPSTLTFKRFPERSMWYKNVLVPLCKSKKIFLGQQ